MTHIPFERLILWLSPCKFSSAGSSWLQNDEFLNFFGLFLKKCIFSKNANTTVTPLGNDIGAKPSHRPLTPLGYKKLVTINL